MKMKKLTLCLLVLTVTTLMVLKTVRGDEARAVIEDSVAHGHQEVVPQDTDTHPTDDGPLVSPISHGIPAAHPTGEGSHSKPPGRFQVAFVDFEHVSTPFIISLWIIIAGLAKIGFHVMPKLSLICPESCLLIVVGVAIGLLLFYTGITHVGPLTPNIFFLYMLPPIVLDAGYFMPNRQFFNNLVSILIFAVIGTIWNAMMIGVTLWGIGLTGLYGVELPLLDTLLFSSIVSAVDPVAVLAVFEEIQVDEVLYILVFGESLLNDAVTVVLYHMFEGYTTMAAHSIAMIPTDYVAGVASFFVVALGGTLVGIIWGLIAAFISRFTHHVRVIEPLFVFIMAYLAYLSAELFHLSGILALTFAGITMKNYVEENISYKSHVTVKYTMKMLASSSETIIFMFLGVSTVNDQHNWNTWFVVLTILFCTIYRAIGVIILSSLANRFRLHRFNKVDQFIIAYGGLRGAVAFALVLVIEKEVIPAKDMMVTTVIAVVYFTVFIQGMTIGPLVRLLNVPTSTKTKPSMNERIHVRLMDHLMAGIEDIAGQMMGNYHLRDKFKYYNNKYLRPFLTRDHAVREPKIFETYSKLNLADAMNLVKQNGNLVPVMGADNSVSLSTLFRSYTQANFHKSPPRHELLPLHFPNGGSGETVNELSIPHNSSGLLNFDMGELEYCPSSKDLADAEIHHILSDAMFKPPKKFRRYSRNFIYENKTHPPFHHQMRMQIRQMAGDNNLRHRKKSRVQNGYGPNGHKSGCKHKVPQGQQHPTLRFDLPDRTPTSSSSNGGSSQASPVKELKPTSPNNMLSPSGSLHKVPSTDSHEDEGIMFVARSADNTNTNTDMESYDYDTTSGSPPTSPRACRTVTETTLPWKRGDEDVTDGRSVRQQNEFPSWIENKDYLAYISPTNTFLGKLGGPQRNLTPVFEIFEARKIAEVEPEVEEEGIFGERDNSNYVDNETDDDEDTSHSSSGDKRQKLVEARNEDRFGGSQGLYPSLVAAVARRLSKNSSSPPSDSTVVTIASDDDHSAASAANLAGGIENRACEHDTVIDLNERRRRASNASQGTKL